MTLRDKILYMLESNRGEYISGQSIAQSAGVSRNAVSKCISSLKEEGYPIDSVNNLGHRLDTDCDILSESGILARLGGRSDCHIKLFKTIDSTNSEAKREISNGLEGCAIFVAKEQTAGRGRHGRSFYSPNESGLYFSCVLHPNVSLSDSALLTSAAAVAVCEAIEGATKKDPMIKWVNDIFIDSKKVCGILTEAVSDFESGKVEAVIIGIGINLTTEHFPEELSGIAASVGKIYDRCKLIADIFIRLESICANLPDNSFMDSYRSHSLVLGRSISFTRNANSYTAKALAINDNGELEVETSEGERIILNSGEISIKLD